MGGLKKIRALVLALIALTLLVLNLEKVYTTLQLIPADSSVHIFDIEYSRQALLKCNYFTTKYPEAAERLATEKFTVKNSTMDNERQSMCGQYIPYLGIILIHPRAYTPICGDTVYETIGHEMLHQVGLPDHPEDFNPITDDIYVVEAVCLSRLETQ